MINAGDERKQSFVFILKCSNLNVLVSVSCVTGSSSYLEDDDIRLPVGAELAPVDLDVLQPLDVRLRVTEHFTLELHVAAHHYGAVSRQAGLQDRPVGGALCTHTQTSTNLV